MNARRPRDWLFELVPELYRKHDEAQGHPLRALLRVLAQQANILEDDLDALYDDWFIETCRAQLIPYLGELVGYRASEDVPECGRADAFEGRLRDRVITPRREVARAVALRRRKGTLPALEELARDTTAWPARAVEFRRLLALAQNVRHVHLARGGTTEVRDARALERLGGPFETQAHAIDVRNAEAERAPGRYAIASLGLFVWRIPGFEVNASRVYRHERTGNTKDGCFSFNVLGIDTPLYTCASGESNPPPAGPGEVPMRLSRRELAARRARFAGERPPFMSPDPSFAILIDGKPANRPIVAADLSRWSYPIALNPTQDLQRPILVDPELGRFLIYGVPSGTQVRASWRYGFSAAIGGGEYARTIVEPPGLVPWTPAAAREASEGERPKGWYYRVSDQAGDFKTLLTALLQWEQDDPQFAVIELMDNEVYSHHVEIRLAKHQHLIVRAAAGRRPILRLLDSRPDQSDAFLVRGQADSRFTLEGLIVTGRALRIEGELRRFEMRHCTLVPTRARGREDESAIAESSLQIDRLAEDSEIVIEHSILGPIVVEDSGEPLALCVADSIIDGLDGLDDRARAIWSGRDGYGVAARVALQIRRTTVFGEVHAHVIDLAEDSIFTGCVHVELRQRGCMRFCSIHCGEATPRRFHCQPDRAIADAGAQSDARAIERITARTMAVFVSRRYGDPEYARLADHCDPAISRGAHDESEMGVFHDLYTPQRMARLRDMVREFVPADAEVGVIPVT